MTKPNTKPNTKRRPLGSRFVGWLANFYPGYIFYSSDFFPNARVTHQHSGTVHDFSATEADDPRLLVLTVAAVIGARLNPGETLETSHTAVTHKGRDIGDVDVVITRRSEDTPQ